MTEAELLARVDERTQTILDRCDTHTVLLKEQNGRISEIEKWQARLLGFCAFVPIIVPVIIWEVREHWG